ncbi:hypothetical protein LINPERPRIM_LOCUS40887 [Linum perenne]
MWLVNGLVAAFFPSLDRCSCIKIATVDEGNGDAPLIMNDDNITHRAMEEEDGRCSKSQKAY